MKILFINTIAGRTAVGQIIDLIADSAIERGHDVYIASGYGRSKIDRVKSIKIGHAPDRYIHALCTRVNDSHALHSIRATSILIDEIIKIKPDVIHLHNLHGYYLNLPLIVTFLKKTSIPIFITLHDFWLLTGHCAYPMASKCNKYQAGLCGDCEQSSSYPKTHFDFSSRNIIIKQNLFSDFDNLNLIVLSNWMSDVVHNSWLKQHPIFIIPNGIDTELFKPQNVTQKKMVLAVANVWTKEKGLHHINTLREKLPEEYEILVIGIGENQQKHLSLGVNSIDYVANRDLATYYSSALVTINLSVCEAFGLTLIESMACGTPVVSFDNSTPSELITESTGAVVADGDVVGIVKAIENIKKEDYSERCRAEVVAIYDKKLMCEKYVNLFELKG